MLNRGLRNSNIDTVFPVCKALDISVEPLVKDAAIVELGNEKRKTLGRRIEAYTLFARMMLETNSYTIDGIPLTKNEKEDIKYCPFNSFCSNNCKHTYLVSSPKGLDYKILNRYESVGIVSGASTPIDESMEVYTKMSEMNINTMDEAVALIDEKKALIIFGEKGEAGESFVTFAFKKVNGIHIAVNLQYSLKITIYANVCDVNSAIGRQGLIKYINAKVLGIIQAVIIWSKYGY